MSTNCFIAVKESNDTYTYIYCHWDGYNSGTGVGPTLREFHNSLEHAKALVALGNLRSINEDVPEPFCVPTDDLWNEDKASTVYSRGGLVKRATKSNMEYIYIFEDNSWTSIDLTY